jgi:tetratricopeptide (TPR) repeat protein
MTRKGAGSSRTRETTQRPAEKDESEKTIKPSIPPAQDADFSAAAPPALIPWDKVWGYGAWGSFALAVVFLFLVLVVRSKAIASVRAEYAVRREDWAAAAKFYQRSLGAAPESAKANVTLAGCLAEAGKMDQARERIAAAFQKVSEIEKDAGEMAHLYALKAWTEFDGDKEAAVADAREALKRNEDHAMANAVLVRYYMDKQQPADARKYFEKIILEPRYGKLAEDFRKQMTQMVAGIPESELQDVPEKAAAPTPAPTPAPAPASTPEPKI